MALGVLYSILFSTGHAGATGTFMQVRELTSIPAGHAYYCASNPKACARYGRGVIALTQQSWDQLVEINARVNRSITPVEDGIDDTWSAYVSQGDCEDYALTKQRELLRAGWPSDALLLTTAYLNDGTYHAVLLVRTDWGEFVLDNLNPEILPWQDVRYHWNKRQAVGNPHAWQRIAGAPVTSADQPLAGLQLRPAQP
ncbi:transglutaminase-like cysteine peptidase [Cohaesibacter sp. ES.047]|uniref:transglutaminase-like cysteine peptidase n=1 Tax=Cohaesibacter sp. ES.047 TaxID=1798205 RepID=UPI000BB9990D|nr:transglutaminase-like cysteine peptidase [Cohaesibacter sp. ES.047]